MPNLPKTEGKNEDDVASEYFTLSIAAVIFIYICMLAYPNSASWGHKVTSRVKESAFSKSEL